MTATPYVATAQLYWYRDAGRWRQGQIRTRLTRSQWPGSILAQILRKRSGSHWRTGPLLQDSVLSERKTLNKGHHENRQRSDDKQTQWLERIRQAKDFILDIPAREG